MKIVSLLAISLMFLASAAFADPGVTPLDPRLAQPTIDAYTAMLKLREAEMRALAEDAGKRAAEREKQWADYFSAYTGKVPATAEK